MEQQGLRSGRGLVINGLPIPGGALVHRLDFIALRGRQIGFGAGALVGRVGVGKRSGVGLPYPSLHPILVGQCDGDDRGEVGAKTFVRLPWRGVGPAGDVEAVAVLDHVAGAGDHGLGVSHLRLGGLTIELNE